MQEEFLGKPFVPALTLLSGEFERTIVHFYLFGDLWALVQPDDPVPSVEMLTTEMVAYRVYNLLYTGWEVTHKQENIELKLSLTLNKE